MNRPAFDALLALGLGKTACDAVMNVAPVRLTTCSSAWLDVSLDH